MFFHGALTGDFDSPGRLFVGARSGGCQQPESRMAPTQKQREPFPSSQHRYSSAKLISAVLKRTS
jgi:hypothetical protein